MNWMDLSINLVESILFAWLISRFVDIDKEKKIYFYIVYCFVITLETSALNFFTFYDGLYSFLFVLISYSFLVLFEDKQNQNNRFSNLIYIINLDTMLSAGNELFFLLSYFLLGLSPNIVYTTLPILIGFILSRFFFLIIMITIHKFTSKYKKLNSSHTVYFVFIFALISVITVLNENVLYQGTDHFILLILKYS